MNFSSKTKFISMTYRYRNRGFKKYFYYLKFFSSFSLVNVIILNYGNIIIFQLTGAGTKTSNLVKYSENNVTVTESLQERD